MAFKQVTIIGTGLIGGSLGLALKKRRLVGRVIGCDRAPVLERAKDCGAIDAGISESRRRCARQRSRSSGHTGARDSRSHRAPGSGPSAAHSRHRRRQHEAEVAKRAAKSFGKTAGTALPRRTSHGGQGAGWRRVRRCRLVRRRGVAVHAAATTECSRRNVRRVRSLRRKTGRESGDPRSRRSTIVSAHGSAICRR